MLIEKLIGIERLKTIVIGKFPSDSLSLTSTDKKVNIQGRMLGSVAPNNTLCQECHHCFSPLRLLWWASLLIGVGAQNANFFPREIELANLSPDIGFVINGEASRDESGLSVSCVGDVNGDGIVDLLIGAYKADPPKKSKAGKSYLVYGNKDLGRRGIVELSNLNSTTGIVINGEEIDDLSGHSVSGFGDINGDGVSDIIIGAYDATTRGFFPISRAGKTYVLFGGNSFLNGGNIELSNINGSNGFVINGEQAEDFSGYSVSNAGDMNGDGTDDLIIGAYHATPLGRSEAGKTYVVFGGKDIVRNGVLALSSLNGTNGFILYGEGSGDHSGRSVSTAGDVNGDGFADIMIGSQDADPPNRGNAGKVYIVFGGKGIGSSGVVELSSLNGKNGFVTYGEQSGDDSGVSVSGTGDVNGDGIDDIIIGARDGDPLGRMDAGKTYVVFGSKGIANSGVIELSTLNGKNGLVIYGENLDDRSGYSVSGAGDVNGDGFADILIGTRDANPNGKLRAGRSYLIFGGSQLGKNGIIDLKSLNGADGIYLNGEDMDDRSGGFVSSAGDLNADGITDFVIGAYRASPDAQRDQAGKTYVVFGRKTSVSMTFDLTKFTTLLPSITQTLSTQGSTNQQPTNKFSKTNPTKFSSRIEISDQLTDLFTSSSYLALTSSEERKNIQSSLIQLSKQTSEQVSQTFANRMTKEFHESVGTNLIFGIAGVATALSCMSIAGLTFAWCQHRKRKHDRENQIEVAVIPSENRTISPHEKGDSTVYGNFDNVPQTSEYNLVGAPLDNLDYESVHSPLTS